METEDSPSPLDADPDLTRRTDTLLQPSLQDVDVWVADEGSRPWRLYSQLYVGFFGGPIAVTPLAWENADRLGAPRATKWSILTAGAAGLIAMTIAGYQFASYGTGAQLVYRAVGVCTALVLCRLQRSPDRVYQFRTAAHEAHQYDSLVAPGLIAVVVGFMLQAGINAVVRGLVG